MINSRRLLSVLTWIVLLTSGVQVCRAAEKPHVILFLASDLGARDSGCYGNDDVKTPHIDQLADQGMRFTNAFAASPASAPARAAIFTGLYPIRHGGDSNPGKVKVGVETWPAYFKGLGYRVVFIGRQGVAPKSAFAFENLLPDGVKSPSAAGKALDQLLAKPGDKPLCVVVDMAPSEKAAVKYDAAKLTLSADLVDTPVTRAAVASYYARVSAADALLGQCLDLLKRRKLEEKTVVAFTADNGPPLPRGKWSLYDRGIHVPLIIRWTGTISAGGSSKALISQIDILPTLLDLIDGLRPEKIDGRSFLSVLKERRVAHRDLLYAVYTGDDSASAYPMRCLRTSTEKMIVNFKHMQSYALPGKGGPRDELARIWDSWKAKARTDAVAASLTKGFSKRPPLEVYDLDKDELERKNIATDAAEKDLVQAFRFRIKLWMRQQKDKLK